MVQVVTIPSQTAKLLFDQGLYLLVSSYLELYSFQKQWNDFTRKLYFYTLNPRNIVSKT